MTDAAWNEQLRREVADALTEPTEVLNRATDRANGQEIAERFGDQLMWTPEQGWFRWDGPRWAGDVLRRRELWIGTLTDQLRMRADVTANDVEQTVLQQRVSRLETGAGVDGALRFAAPLLARSVVDLDPDPLRLNCPNGTLDLRTGHLGRHDPLHLITRITPTDFDEKADDEVWRRVVWEALDGDEHKIRSFGRFSGYTLTGLTTEKKFIVCNGPTNTGKSTVTEPLYRTLGDVGEGGYATVWDADVVQADAQVNRSEKLNKVRGARLILVGELAKGSRLADNFVKQLTGGDTMDARQLYKDSYSYRPDAKLWMATNYVPASADPAVHGRLLMLPFVHVPPVIDAGIKKHLDEDEGAHRALLAWAVRAAREWYRLRTFGDMPWHEEAVRHYATASDHVLQFMQERLCQVDSYEGSSTPQEVWLAYNLVWAPENVQRPMKRRTFERALEEHGLKRGRGTHGAGATRWVGYRVIQSSDGGT